MASELLGIPMQLRQKQTGRGRYGGVPEWSMIMVSEDLRKSAADTASSLKQAASDAADSFGTATEMGRKAAAEGYDQAREYASRGADYVGGLSESVAEFVSREPWMAIAGAFVVGYVAAQILRRASR
jgi:ElaB/YqjD/DUF883 family membrane-anchored ribosome-binding protein